VANIFKHSSRSYFDFYNAYIAAYPNKPTWLFEELAGLAEFQSELMNRIASDILTPQTREAAYGFASRCDYEPVEADGATVTMTITLTGAITKTLPIGYQVGGISTTTGKLVLFELTAIGVSGGTDTITVNTKQTESFTSINIGTVNTTDDFSDYPITGYQNIIKSSVSATINSLTWTRVDNFDASTSTDRHFVVLYQSNGKARIQFGDGTNGLKPTVNDVIYLDFKTTQGLLGKMAAGEIDLNVGGDTDISSLTNASATSGGNDSETVSSIIRNARGNVRLRDAVWSKEDLETAARQASSSIQKALGIPGVGEATIHIIPSGGGAPSAGLKTQVDTYVTALTQFGKMPVTVSDPNYNTVNITATTTVRSGFTAATVYDLVEFGLTLVATAIDNQVIEYYQDNGIDATRTDIINVIWSWAFTSSENDALAFIIDQWVSLLGSRDFREWGQALEVGDLWIMGNSLYDYGSDIFSLTSPTSNQTVTSVQIIDAGTVTVT
jgi:hypothetical protein